MSADDTTQGRRYPDVEDPSKPHDRMGPGGYRREAGRWTICDPTGHLGTLGSHTVTEHDDGTVTVSPSILSTKAEHGHDWHGYLERGVWREV